MKTDPLTDPVAEAERALKEALGIRPSDAPPVPTTDNRVLAEFLERYQQNALALARRYAAERALAELDEMWPQVARLPLSADRRQWLGQRWNLRREALEKEIADAR